MITKKSHFFQLVVVSYSANNSKILLCSGVPALMTKRSKFGFLIEKVCFFFFVITVVTGPFAVFFLEAFWGEIEVAVFFSSNDNVLDGFTTPLFCFEEGETVTFFSLSVVVVVFVSFFFVLLDTIFFGVVKETLLDISITADVSCKVN